MKRIFTVCLSAVFSMAFGGSDPVVGTPEIQSIGTLEFTGDGILFIGDSQAGKVFAVDLDDNQRSSNEEALNITDLEGKVAALLGAKTEDVLIHDLAVNPISQNAYLSVSRARAKWESKWQTANHLADARTLIKVTPSGEISEVVLEDVLFSSASLPNPVSADKEHRWFKGTKLRTEAIVDIAYRAGKVYVAGLSNEEFASAMWVFPYPFEGEGSATTLEIFHGAHGKYETHSPVRAFLPYELNDEEHLIAAYLCTPLVTFPTADLENGQHIKGKTVAEFGAGNFPIDMVSYENNGNDYILMSNSQLPLLLFDPQDVADYEGEIKEEVQGYLAGVKYTPRSGGGIGHMADFNSKFILAIQRLPSGKLSLVSLSKEWLIP